MIKFALYISLFLVIGCLGKKNQLSSNHPVISFTDKEFVNTNEFSYVMDTTLGVHLIYKSQQKVALAQDSVIIAYQNTENDFINYTFSALNYKGKWTIHKYNPLYNDKFNFKQDSFSQKDFSSFTFIDYDSVLLDNDKIYICDMDFNIHYSYNIDKILNSTKAPSDKFSIAAHNNKFKFQIYKSNIIGSKVRNFKQNIQYDREDSTSFFIFNTKTEKADVFSVPLPDNCTDFVWGFKDAEQYGLVNKNRLYVCYPFSEEITIFDLDTKKWVKKKIQSAFHNKDDISYVYTQKQFYLLNKLNQSNKFWEKYTVNSNYSASYSELIYEPKYDRFIRLYFDSQPIKNEKGLFNLNSERHAYLMVLDSSLDILYEIDLGVGFNDFIPFTSYGKVYINFNNQNLSGNSQKFNIEVISFNK